MSKLTANEIVAGDFVATRSKVKQFLTILDDNTQVVIAIEAIVFLYKDDETYAKNKAVDDRNVRIIDLSGWNNPMTDEETLAFIESKLPANLNTANE